MKKWNKKHWLCVIAICLVVISVWILLGNTKLEITEYFVASARIPVPFDGFEIAQISDLHNAEFGDENKDLLVLLSQIKPDVIVLTGDLIDSRHTDIEIALDFAGKAVQIAPVYYVTGNHEARVPEYEQLKTGLTDLGVTVLENQKVQISKDG